MLSKKPMREALIGSIHQAMFNDPKYFFLSADLGAPALDDIRRDFPGRFLNVGIAEPNLINVAAGLAMEGFTVFTYAIAPFYLRAFEQIRINIALPAQLRPMNVNMLALGAGMSYDVSGPTHHCLEDLSVMRSLPNLMTLSPADSLTTLAIANMVPGVARPKYIRLDGKVFLPARDGGPETIDLRKGFARLRSGRGVCIAATGFMVHQALQIADRFAGNVSVIDIFRLDDDIDHDGLAAVLTDGCHTVISLQEAFVNRGGLDAMVSTVLGETGAGVRHRRLGMRSEFDFVAGGRAQLHARNGLALDDIASAVAQALPLAKNANAA